jgi:hypothetical protein
MRWWGLLLLLCVLSGCEDPWFGGDEVEPNDDPEHATDQNVGFNRIAGDCEPGGLDYFQIAPDSRSLRWACIAIWSPDWEEGDAPFEVELIGPGLDETTTMEVRYETQLTLVAEGDLSMSGIVYVRIGCQTQATSPHYVGNFSTTFADGC